MLGHDVTLDGFREAARVPPLAVPVGEGGAQDLLVPERAGGDSGGDPQFRAWLTLASPVIGYIVRGWPARFGLVAAGLGICVVPEVAALSVPAGVATVAVEDPGWQGRMTVAVTARPAAEAAAVVDALRAAGAAIRGDLGTRPSARAQAEPGA